MSDIRTILATISAGMDDVRRQMREFRVALSEEGRLRVEGIADLRESLREIHGLEIPVEKEEDVVIGPQRRAPPIPNAPPNASINTAVEFRNNTGIVPPKDAVRYVKNLRGSDDTGVEEFIISVERARKTCNDEGGLLMLILNEKITDNAEKAIRGLSIRNFEDLAQALRAKVGTRNTYEIARANILSIRQREGESVKAYDLRFLEKFNDLRYVVFNDPKLEPHEKQTILRMEERQAIKTFINGLNTELFPFVRAARIHSLQEASLKATETEIDLAERRRLRPIYTERKNDFRPRNMSINKSRFDSSNYAKPKPAYPADYKPNTGIGSKSQSVKPNYTCFICNKEGHISKDCPKRGQNFQTPRLERKPPFNRVHTIETEESRNQEEEYTPDKANYGMYDGSYEEPENEQDL